MTGLVIEVKQNELMLINGASLRFKTKSKIEIIGKANFLFGRQVVLRQNTATPALQIYFALQTAYTAEPSESAAAADEAKCLIAQFTSTSQSALAREILGKIITLLEAQYYIEALKLTRRIIQHEAALAKTAPPPC